MHLKLSSPIVVKGKEVTEIELRDITGRDALEIGLPFLLLKDGEIIGLVFRPKALVQYISRLAGIPCDTVKSLSMTNLAACHAHILSFFGDDLRGDSDG